MGDDVSVDAGVTQRGGGIHGISEFGAGHAPVGNQDYEFAGVRTPAIHYGECVVQCGLADGWADV